MAMMDWGFYHYSIQVADSVHEEWPGSTLLMWGEATTRTLCARDVIVQVSLLIIHESVDCRVIFLNNRARESMFL